MLQRPLLSHRDPAGHVVGRFVGSHAGRGCCQGDRGIRPPGQGSAICRAGRPGVKPRLGVKADIVMRLRCPAHFVVPERSAFAGVRTVSLSCRSRPGLLGSRSPSVRGAGRCSTWSRIGATGLMTDSTPRADHRVATTAQPDGTRVKIHPAATRWTAAPMTSRRQQHLRLQALRRGRRQVPAQCACSPR